ncbi:Cobalt-zinc-cadmium resistance protein CzcC [Sphingobium sp. AntQ-1]|uniref:TolC family protein n=1 Tax=Sphingobium sp. AntQ-1 TaxID=2930091 RepID=UPI00234EACCA|nr:TolC family protein [Sphingobium sp. AntQ-1]WCP13999.1 Cobalt-zinc-cadmium resistance protein CzcC [Sphingobium sp. AntQ-1]
MHRIIAAALAATPCVAVAQAQDNIATGQPVGPALTLDQAVTIAGGSAPAANAAQAGIDAAQAARTVAGLRPNPEIQSQVENVVGSGPYGGVRQAETTVGINIPIELGGKRSARIAIADAQFHRAALVAAITQADIRLQVTTLYVDAIAAERRLVTARDQLRIAHDALNAARIRVQAGRASPLEEQRADVATRNADAEVQKAQRLAQALRANLERRVGQPIAGALDGSALDHLPPPSLGPTRTTSADTLALAAADADLAIADAGVQLARSQRIPDVTVGPAVRRLSATNDTAAVLSLSIPIPLFNAGQAAVAQASAQRVRAEAQRRMTSLDVEQAITDAQAEADNAATAARNARGPALAAAQEAARIARIGYREGKFGQLDLLDAERTLSQTRLAAIDALASYQNARARLERLIAPAPVQGN